MLDKRSFNCNKMMNDMCKYWQRLLTKKSESQSLKADLIGPLDYVCRTLIQETKKPKPSYITHQANAREIGGPVGNVLTYVGGLADIRITSRSPREVSLERDPPSSCSMFLLLLCYLTVASPSIYNMYQESSRK